MQLETHSLGNLRFRMRRHVAPRVSDSLFRQVSLSTWVAATPTMNFTEFIRIIRTGMHKQMYW